MANRHWVGGTGDWSDNTNHWSATSGGSPGASLPGAVDDVFFDTNSAGADYAVTVNASTRTCRSITMTAPAAGNLTLTGSQQLTVEGSWTGYAGLVNTLTGVVSFQGTSSFTITSAGVAFAGNVTFTGTGGTFTLLDDLVSPGTINLNRGTFDANDFNVTAAIFDSNNSNTRSLLMGSGTWTLSSTSTAWTTVTTTNLTFNAETSIINFTNTTQTFRTGGLTFYTVNFNNATPNGFIIGDVIFNSLSVTGAGDLTQTGGSIFNISNLTANTSNIQMSGTGTDVYVTTNGVSFYRFTAKKTSATVYLVDDITCTGDLFLSSGGLDVGNITLNIGESFISNNSTVRNLEMHGSVWNFTGTGTVWSSPTSTNFTLNHGTSLIHVNNTSGTVKSISAGGLTLNDVTMTGDNVRIVASSISVNNLTLNIGGYATGFRATAGITITVRGAFITDGSAGNLAILRSLTAASAFTLSKTTGMVSEDYLSLRDSAATGGAVWYAGANSTNTSGNSGWIFTAPPAWANISSFDTAGQATIGAINTSAKTAIATIDTKSV